MPELMKLPPISQDHWIENFIIHNNRNRNDIKPPVLHIPVIACPYDCTCEECPTVKADANGKHHCHHLPF